MLPPSMTKEFQSNELPEWITGKIGYCPHCKKGNMLLFVLWKKSCGYYQHCMICNQDFQETSC